MTKPKIIPAATADAATDSKQVDRVEQNHACDPPTSRPLKKARNRKPAPFTRTSLRRACQVAARFGNSWCVTLTAADGSKVTVESGGYAPSNVENGAANPWDEIYATDKKRPA